MTRIVIGIIIGIALSGGVAAATGWTMNGPPVKVPRGDDVIVSDPGPQDVSTIRFQHFDVKCSFLRSSGPPPEDTLTNEPLLWCGRASNYNNGRRVLITPYRIFVVTGAGSITYRVTRSP